ncbi:TolC family protein [Marinilabilia rubra]|uniref:TolC family protein n=1 Tax=Marinilabilia rubra TaxID=2162893 RepID=A0A2U2BB02_9BACT|nr:TolC family protein [Marinilabilia rubra]PWE00241.1 TolC family protein [Marinilabilia rubra]
MKQIITYLIFTVVSIWPVMGQNDDGNYSLDQLIVEALENNYDIRISEADLEIAELNNTLGNAGMFPTLSWESSLSNNFNDRYDNDNQTGSLQNGVRLNWMLFNGFSAHIRKDRLETMEELSGGNLALLVENTIQAVVMAYYRALFAEEQLTLLQEVMQLSEDRLQYMEDRVDLGAATSYEALQARTAYLTDKTAYLEQEVNVLSTLRELKYLIGKDEGEALELSGKLSFEARDYNLDELLSKIESSNQSIQNQYMNLALLEQQRVLQQRSRFPSLNANAGAGHNMMPESLNSASDAPGFSDGYFSYFVNFSLSFTLFDGDRINRNVQIARMEEAIGQTNLEEMKHRLKNQLFNLFDQYRVRRELVEVGRENRETARVNMQLSEEKFRAGAINSFNYRDVQLSYLQTSINYYRSVLNLIDTHTSLVRITGGIVEEYE